MNASMGELRDFLAFVVLYGPDRFPAWREMTIPKTFFQIREALDGLAHRLGSTEIARMIELCDTAESEYASGGVVKGAHILQDLAATLSVERSSG